MGEGLVMGSGGGAAPLHLGAESLRLHARKEPGAAIAMTFREKWKEEGTASQWLGSPVRRRASRRRRSAHRTDSVTYVG